MHGNLARISSKEPIFQKQVQANLLLEKDSEGRIPARLAWALHDSWQWARALGPHGLGSFVGQMGSLSRPRQFAYYNPDIQQVLGDSPLAYSK